MEFKSDKDLDREILSCGFAGTGGLPCKVKAYGYIHLDGPKLRIVITSFEAIDPPRAME